jgi:glyoxylase-like metal-dependent hydrolase (beta-lactamase superfamily II)
MDWSEPGVEQVTANIFRVPVPLPNDGLRAVNVYALCSGDGVVLVDGGWAFAGSLTHLETGLRQIGRRLDDVRQVLVTHAHRDHYTQAAALRQRRAGTQITLGEGERGNIEEMIAAGRENRVTRRFAALDVAGSDRLIAWAADGATPVGEGWEPPDVWAKDGTECVAGEVVLRVIATPGHTTGHVVYRDAAGGLLFAGDHVLPRITPSIGFEAAPVRWPLRDYLDSLALMLTLPDTRLLPAHGPVTASVHDRVRELLAHHDARLRSTLRAVADGARTGYETAGRLPWTRRSRPLDELDAFNQCLAVSETMAHLDVLVLRGQLHCTQREDGARRYAVR